MRRRSFLAASAAPFTYQPLFPFRSADEAGQWQESYRKDHATEPWHLDTNKTALEFTQHFGQFIAISHAGIRGKLDAGSIVRQVVS